MANFALDQFTGASGTTLDAHTPDIGVAWAKNSVGSIYNTVLDGTGAIRFENVLFRSYYITADPPSADYQVQATSRIVNSLLVGGGYVAARIQPGANTMYFFGWNQDGSNHTNGVILWKVVGGSYTNIGTAAQAVVDAADYILRISVSGSTIKCYVNGVEKISVTDSGITSAGKAGVMGSGPDVATELRNFSAGDGAADLGVLVPVRNTDSLLTLDYIPPAGVTLVSKALHVGDTSAFTPSSGTLVSSSPTFPFTSTSGVRGKYWKLVANDGSADIITDGYYSTPSFETLKIGFIGDSITAGWLSTPPPTLIGSYLSRIGKVRSVSTSNAAVSGTDTSHWLPMATEGYLSAALTSFATAGATVVHAMLGTNDSRSSVRRSKADYKANVTTIAAAITAAGMTPIFSASPYAVPSLVGSSGYDDTANSLMRDYLDALRELASARVILLGDDQSQRYFSLSPSELADGLHPNPLGSASLAFLWAVGIDRAMNPSSTSGGPRTYTF